MSTLRVQTNQSVIRLTPEGDTNSTVVLRSAESVVKISQVGMPGEKGAQGDPGRDGEDGQAQIPEYLDGGNF